MQQKTVCESKRFKDNVNGLVKVVRYIINEHAKDMINKLVLEIATRFIERMDRITLIEGFIIRSYSHWSHIKNRDDKFFLEAADKIFGELPANDVNMFKKLFTPRPDGTQVINDKMKSVLWDYFEANVRISIKYILANESRKGLVPGIDMDQTRILWLDQK